MPSPMKHEVDFSPEGIVKLCPELALAMKVALLNRLDKSWCESEPFEVEIDVPTREEPYVYFLRVEVDPSDGQVTIERRLA